MKPVINITVRGFTLLSKFIFIFILAIYLDAANIVYYGILMAVVTYLGLIIGLELHNFTSKKIISDPSSSNQTVVNIILTSSIFFLISLPIIYIANNYIGFIIKEDFYLITSIIFLEVLALEISRILNITGHQILSSILIFIKSGLWCLIYMIGIRISIIIPSVDSVIQAWFIGNFLATFFGFICIIKSSNKNRFKIKIDLRWIKAALKSVMPMIPVAITYQGFFTFDRILMKNNIDLNVGASYMVYASSATALLTIIDAGLIAFFMPRILKSSYTESRQDFERHIKLLNKLTIIIMLIVLPIFSIFIYHLIIFLGKTNYIDNFNLYIILSVAVTLFILSTIPHIGLYALNAENEIMKIQIFCFIFYLICSIILNHVYPNFGVSISLLLTFALIYFLKIRAYRFKVKNYIFKCQYE